MIPVAPYLRMRRDGLIVVWTWPGNEALCLMPDGGLIVRSTAALGTVFDARDPARGLADRSGYEDLRLTPAQVDVLTLWGIVRVRGVDVATLSEAPRPPCDCRYFPSPCPRTADEPDGKCSECRAKHTEAIT